MSLDANSTSAPTRSRTLLVTAGVVAVLFVISAVIAVSAGGDEPTIAPSDDALGWTMPARSRTFDVVQIREMPFPADKVYEGAVGSPDQLYLFFQDFADDDPSGVDGLEYQVESFDAAGNKRWMRSFEGDVLAWPFGNSLIVYNRETFLSSTGVLLRLSPTSGETLWEVDVTAQPRLSADFDGRAYMTDGKKLMAVDLETGEVVGSAFHQYVGDVNDLRRGGGIAVRDRTDVVVLDAELAEIVRFPANGDGAVSYSNGQVLALDKEYPFDEANTARLYGADGVEVANFDFDTDVSELTTIADSTWLYANNSFGAQICGGIRFSAADAALQNTWQADDCDPQADAQLDDGATYVMSFHDGDVAQGEFYNAATGERVDIPDGIPTLGTNCFMTISYDALESYLVMSTGEQKTSDAATVTLIDNGVLLRYRTPEGNDFMAVYASVS